MRECVERIRKERTTPTSPRIGLRRVLVLAEGRQFREAAIVLQKLNCNSVAAVAGELPLDFLVEGLPHSAQLLETLFNKLIQSGQKPHLNAEQVIWHLVRLFATHDDPTLRTKTTPLSRTLLEFQPTFQQLVAARKSALEQAVQGLGCHGLTADSTGLAHFHFALKTELNRHIEAYKSALHRIDELGLLATTDSKRPVDASHQRLLGLHHNDVQQRLIDNKTLLTILDKPDLKQLQPLVGTLATRVQNDKEALFCVSQIKRLVPVCEDKPVAALLMTFSKGCKTLLDQMKPSDCTSSSDGYYSGSEPDQDSKRDVINRYAKLYLKSRPQALAALDSLPELQHATQLKSKILFSVVVLAFRTCKSLRDVKVRDTFRILYVDGRTNLAQTLRNDILRYLEATSDSFPLGAAENQVFVLLCSTLKEYHCLDNCQALKRYVSEVTRVIWQLVNQVPSFQLDVDFQIPVQFKPDCHQRHQLSDCTNGTVRSYLWPALLVQNEYVFKAVVLTGTS